MVKQKYWVSKYWVSETDQKMRRYVERRRSKDVPGIFSYWFYAAKNNSNTTKRNKMKRRQIREVIIWTKVSKENTSPVVYCSFRGPQRRTSEMTLTIDDRTGVDIHCAHLLNIHWVVTSNKRGFSLWRKELIIGGWNNIIFSCRGRFAYCIFQVQWCIIEQRFGLRPSRGRQSVKISCRT